MEISGTNFTNDLNDGEEFLYTTIRCKDDKEVTLLCKYVKVSVAALGLMLGLSSCDSFFAEMPGIRYDIEMSFKDQVKT